MKPEPRHFSRWKARVIGPLALLSLVATAYDAAAHHSFAMFDDKQTLTFVGPVSKWEWSNPHSWIYLKVTDPDKGTAEWAIESSSPSAFSRRGGTKNMIKVGDTVTVRIHPRKDGTNGGSLLSVTLVDGRTIGGPGQPSNPAPQ